MKLMRVCYLCEIYNIYCVNSGQLAMIGLRCLTLLFAPLKKKKLERDIPFILKIVPVSI